MAPTTSRAGKGGPQTPAGKARSSRNATKHGLLSSRVLLEHENPRDLDALASRLRDQLAPVGEMEAILVDRIIANTWRHSRALRVEQALMDNIYARRFSLLEPGPEQRRREALISTVSNEYLDQVHRYETSIERQLYRAFHELQYLQASRLTGVPLVPGTLHVTLAAPPLPPRAAPPET